MSKRQDEDDAGPNDELQRAHDWDSLNWEDPNLEIKHIPESLRHLLPVAKKWAVIYERTYHADVERITPEESLQLREQTHRLARILRRLGLRCINGF